MANYNDLISEVIGLSFKKLLSHKHLYQYTNIDLFKIIKEVKEEGGLFEDISKADQSAAISILKSYLWRLASTKLEPIFSMDSIRIEIPNISIYCPICNAREAHAQLNKFSTYSQSLGLSRKDAIEQIFLIDFGCQACQEGTVQFLIYRSDTKLTLVGRNPIESISIPSFIPRDFRKYLSDAILAFNCGQILPSLFMLRTFIEQYVYSMFKPESDEKGAERALNAMEKYLASLPDDFKQRFPSLRSAYERLSEAIHSARLDEELFSTILSELNKHFDAKRLYNI